MHIHCPIECDRHVRIYTELWLIPAVMLQAWSETTQMVFLGGTEPSLCNHLMPLVRRTKSHKRTELNFKINYLHMQIGGNKHKYMLLIWLQDVELSLC